MSASDEILKRVADSYRRMRNTARFLLGNLHEFNPVTDSVPFAEMADLDRWAVQRAATLQKKLLKSYEEYAFHRVYQDLHNFCVVDMGSFYLDILKDRLYTTGRDSLPRRSAQTAMYLIIESMVRWLAPVLSFTAEEIWQELPGKRDDSVFLALFEEPESAGDTAINWDALIDVRETVSRALEALRDQGTIGSALQATVVVHADGPLKNTLQQLGDELRFVFITSEATVTGLAEAPADAVAGEGYKVSVGVSEHEKCVRCWHHRADVGSSPEHPELCGRCVINVSGPGEQRTSA
jgi:isoleucyl-tRNA synthetase